MLHQAHFDVTGGERKFSALCLNDRTADKAPSVIYAKQVKVTCGGRLYHINLVCIHMRKKRAEITVSMRTGIKMPVPTIPFANS